MLTTYKTIAGFGQAEVIIEKSQFIGYAKPVVDEGEALAFIQEIKKKHRDATHNVPAYVLGDNNDIQRCSDDGEPSGTAGVPMLEVLKKAEVRNVCLVVTRYFGGIKLGTGGLVRAYTKGAAIALEAAEVITRQLFQVVAVTIEYPLLGMMQNQLRQAGYTLRDTVYDAEVHLQTYVPVEDGGRFQQQCVEWCNGRCRLETLEMVYLTV